MTRIRAIKWTTHEVVSFGVEREACTVSVVKCFAQGFSGLLRGIFVNSLDFFPVLNAGVEALDCFDLL